MLSPKQYVMIVLFAAYSYGIWHVSSNYTSSDFYKEKAGSLEEEQKKTLEEKARGDKFYKAFLAAKQKNDTKQKNIEKEVAHEIEKPEYAGCDNPDSGVLLIEQAIDNANTRLSTD